MQAGYVAVGRIRRCKSNCSHICLSCAKGHIVLPVFKRWTCLFIDNCVFCLSCAPTCHFGLLLTTAKICKPLCLKVCPRPIGQFRAQVDIHHMMATLCEMLHVEGHKCMGNFLSSVQCGRNSRNRFACCDNLFPQLRCQAPMKAQVT